MREEENVIPFYAEPEDKSETFIPGGIFLWRKYTLSVEEAARYFRIGRAKLRGLIEEDRNARTHIWDAPNTPRVCIITSSSN